MTADRSRPPPSAERGRAAADGGHDRGGDDHDHGSGGHDHAADASKRALGIALAINTGFFVVELAGALLADSLTLLADAVHMITDSASLGLALFAAWVAARPPDAKRTYGYHRAEVLGALINGVFLLGVVGYVLFDAYQRIQNPRPVDADLVILVGLVGLAANVAAAWVLTDHRDSLNVEGAFLHLLADAAGSVAAVALGVALLVSDAYWLDPAFAVVIAGLVLYSTKDLLADSLNILLQGTPEGVDVDDVAGALCRVEGVAGVHDLHVWALDSSRTALSAHVVVTEDVDADAVLARSRELLAREFGVDHATVQVESGDPHADEDLTCYGADG